MSCGCGHPAMMTRLALQVHLTSDESPVIGSGHGADMALVFQPQGAGLDGPTFSAAEKAAACRAFFGRDELGEGVQRLSDGLRRAMVRFARDGTPANFNGVPWPVAHGGIDTNGQMVINTTPRFQQWRVDEIGGPARSRLREALKRLDD